MSSKNKKSSKKMPFHGVGPKLVLSVIPFIIVLAGINIIFYPLFQIPINPLFLIILGTALIVIGFYIYFKSITAVKKAYNKSVLLTSGFFAYMRHPVYSSFVLFMTPGFVCLSNSWFLFSIPIIFYILFRIYIIPEEKYCLEKFGEDYIHYKKYVYALFPKLKKYKRE
ncbi:MAG: isoprenylcysteine carboxylmethyltransferase family protein [Candidatus Lokiarchaeota archaeon]|nr:isoprenylcysteine carboxylmethyltransferase family protein [Candidatus Lokiarchaeota archaeon]